MSDPADRDDSERLRDRRDRSDASATRPPAAIGRRSPVVVASILATTGTAASRTYKVRAQDVTGTEAEGELGILSNAGYDFLAINLGSKAPAVGAAVIVTFVRHRAVFRYD